MQMYTRVFCAVAIALCAAPIAALAADPRPCELFSTKEVASVLGVTPERGQPSEPDVDKDLAATSWTCSWSVGERHFVAAVVRFRSAADATRELTRILHDLMSSPEDDLPKLAEVPGPGEQNFWRSKSGDFVDGATWVSRKGQTVLGVVAFDLGKTMRRETLRESIRDLVASGLKRLP
jgi:hypothetical protein